MSEFKRYHPVVNFIYFLFVIGFSMFFMHPVSLLISFGSSFLYSVMLKGKKTIKKNLGYMIPVVVFMALLNPVFNHQGMTIIEYLPSGNPITLESLIYGVFAAVMIISVICWFSCFNEIMTSDKFICIFGRIIPSLSMILSMTLRFVPRFSKQLKVIKDAQKGIGNEPSKKGIISRIKYGLSIISVMTTWALENSIETADSMKSRGYGLSGRTSFSIFKFEKRDTLALFYILILGIYILIGSFGGGMYFSYFPMLKGNVISPYSVSVFVAYLMLSICPVIIEIWEVRRWKALR